MGLNRISSASISGKFHRGGTRMRLIARLVAFALLLVLVAGIAALVYVNKTGLKAQASPGAIETRVARVIRGAAIPAADKSRVNPLANSKEAAGEGLQHFARYCAMCHGNNGSVQKAAIGKGLYPKPP